MPRSSPARAQTPWSAALRLAALLAGGALLGPFRGAAAGGDAPPAPAPAPATAAYDVAPDGSARYRDLEAALDAAEPGALIRLAPGLFEGRVRINKPVTLRGAGAAATRLAAEVGYDEQAARRERDRDAGLRPTVLVATPAAPGEASVVLEDLTVTGRGADRQGGALIQVASGQARLLRVAAVGSPGDGVVIGRGAGATLEGCLVAGIAREGVVVRGGQAELLGCDLREIRHYGVQIAAGSRARVEGCRIRGALWHGIRYDDASPVIRGNRIERHARSGIYASGRTQAVVEGNLFLDNDLSGLSCWFHCDDLVRGNTFVGGKREALAVIGASQPRIEANVIVGHPTAVQGWRSKDAPFVGPLRLEGNVFWQNGRVAVVPDVATGGGASSEAELPWEGLEARGNRRADPGFPDPAQGDYALPAGAVAGALTPAPSASPWPVGPEEAAFGRVLAAERPAPPSPSAPPGGGANPYGLALAWDKALRSLSDAAGRAAAAQAAADALGSDDPARQHAAFVVLFRTADVAWDRAALRPRLLERLDAAQGAALVDGLRALGTLDPGPADLERLLRALKSPAPGLVEAGTGLLRRYAHEVLEGPVAEAVLRLLDEPGERTRREVLRGLWGARVPPEVEARLLALADPEQAQAYHDVVYFALSTLQEKSPAVVAALARAAEQPDPNVSGRAVWGLSHAVAAAAQPAAADVLLAVVEQRTDAATRSQALRGLALYGGAAHRERLAALRGRPGLDAHSAQALDEALERLGQRLGR